MMMSRVGLGASLLLFQVGGGWWLMCIAINRYSSKYSIFTCDDRIVSDIVRSISALLLLTCHNMLPDREEVYCGDVFKVIRG